MSLKICKGDTVEVITGDSKGHRGQVQSVIRKKNKDGSYDPERVYVIVAGANIVVKHQKPTGRVRTQTGRIEKEAPLHISKVMLVGTDNRPTRAGYEVAANGEKSRIDRRSGGLLPKPKEA
jgi:large subunit ribosomal protein L24